jgi:hypothetical protein
MANSLRLVADFYIYGNYTFSQYQFPRYQIHIASRSVVTKSNHTSVRPLQYNKVVFAQAKLDTIPKFILWEQRPHLTPGR